MDVGQSFTGLGFMGYDNLKKRYTATWMDTNGTSTLLLVGSFDPEGRVLTFSGSADDAMTGKPMKITEKLTIADKNNHTLEMWAPDPAGKPYKMLEITYSRER